MTDIHERMPVHDLGCKCWPHVSEKDAIEVITDVAIASYRDEKRVAVALTTDQLEDAKLGRALREFVEYDGSISRHVDIEGGIGPIQVELFDSNEGSYRAIGPTLLAALTAARRELETTSGTSQTPEPESEDRS